MNKINQFFENRNRRKVAKKIVFALIICTSTIFTILDIISDLLYLLYADFYNPGFKFAVAFFISLIPGCIYIVSLVYFIKKYKESFISKIIGSSLPDNKIAPTQSKKRIIFNTELKMLVYWIIIGPVISLFYPISRHFDYLGPENLRLYIQLTTIEFFAECFPELIIQGINNSLKGVWTDLTRFSFTLSLMCTIRGCYLLATTLYQRQYSAFLKNIESDIIENIYSELLQLNLELSLEELTLKAFIKQKFYEKFNTTTYLFKISHISNFKNEEILHTIIEDKLKSTYNSKYIDQFNIKEFFTRCIDPINIAIIFEVILMLIIWFCNFLYIVIAKFHSETNRYILLFFVVIAFIISLFGSFKNEQMARFSKVIILRMFTVSHFDELCTLLFDREVKTKRAILSETLFCVLGWIPIIAIQAVNNNQVGNKFGIYLGVIVLNSMCLAMSAFRIFHRMLQQLVGKIEISIEPSVLELSVNCV